MNIFCYKYENKPKYGEYQAGKTKNLCKKVPNLLYTSCCLVLDDEKYFTYYGSNMQGNEIYYTNDLSNRCVRFAVKREKPEQSKGLGSHIRSWYLKAIISSIEVRGSQFWHLCKRMLIATLAFIFHPLLSSFHLRASAILKLYFLA